MSRARVFNFFLISLVEGKAAGRALVDALKPGGGGELGGGGGLEGELSCSRWRRRRAWQPLGTPAAAGSAVSTVAAARRRISARRRGAALRFLGRAAGGRRGRGESRKGGRESAPCSKRAIEERRGQRGVMGRDVCSLPRVRSQASCLERDAAAMQQNKKRAAPAPGGAPRRGRRGRHLV